MQSVMQSRIKNVVEIEIKNGTAIGIAERSINVIDEGIHSMTVWAKLRARWRAPKQLGVVRSGGPRRARRQPATNNYEPTNLPLTQLRARRRVRDAGAGCVRARLM
ncbi:hypothetical protein EVAR_67638_1 [Eumeta japonica]|uniref:Uncharacterized protein n=1 Tax=Eumeta variegata TaxID=151549 RepID=A0A4C1ZAT4_EUMVA|nr:hypothetical protein EVAR_67638_1 [Eumeta japonica]